MLGRYGIMRAQIQLSPSRLVQDHGLVRIQGLFLILIFCSENTFFAVSVISYGN
jgi:hypothetical protein